ncbi:stromelysin-1-like [Heteronotia binoei]|uniref:stromelysin-1-like n=1 Tax=Heteronotia binoei TaxID=13085 RepID=UPI002930304C|nr:stromelysin-1-like [Heteronotia binoei]
MKTLLLIIVLCRVLSWAWPVLPSSEQTTEKEAQHVEKEHSHTLNRIRRRRYDVLGTSEYTLLPDFAKWENRTVTYRILNYTQKLPQADVDEIFKEAFEVFSNITCLTFMQSWDASDIQILFGAGIHAEDCPFDEEDGVLAHAYSSSAGGNKAFVHFDEDENWTKDFSGINLMATAVHEFAHILGSDHSASQESLMYEFYGNSNTTFRLSQDDIEGLQALHGKCSFLSERKPGNCSHWPSYPAPPTEIPSEQMSPPLCEQNITFDAVITFKGELLFFDGERLLRKDPEKRKYEMYIDSLWPILRCGIDAAYEAEGTTYIFYGGRYRTANEDLSNLSSSQFVYTLGLPSTEMDAAVHDEETKKTLFFAGDEYWRYDEETRSMEEDYPRKIAADFPEIGSKVDAAFQYNGSLYLLRGPNQYEFDPRTYRFIEIKKTNTWFDCEE